MSNRRASAVAADSPVGVRSVLRNRAFAGLFVAETQSLVGDQIARVALSVMVFDATGSAPATAATYAATLLPAILGGFLLGRLGDRFRRRSVLIGCDVFRAACFAVMAVPGLSLGIVAALLVVAVAVGPVFSAAEVSLLARWLPAEQFRAGNALRMMATQLAQVGGFVFGGLVVAYTGPSVALLLNAATYVVSLLLIGFLVRGAEASGPAEVPLAQPRSDGTDREDAIRFADLWRDRRLRSLITLATLIGLFVVPEGLAVPFARDIGAGTAQVGLLLAAGAAGGAVGAAVLVRRRRNRERQATIMAILCGLPLIPMVVEPGVPITVVCWFVSGVFAAYMVEVTTLIVRAIPDRQRARMVSRLSALVLAGQGAALIGAGGLTRVMPAGVVIAASGALGSLVALGAVGWRSRIGSIGVKTTDDHAVASAGDVAEGSDYVRNA